ncbi:hypothetical protein KQI49_08210 [Virgibacillus sp. MSJ-26]|uniref:hypothetical protein n=1 Tax=Virgibacillus sp. MSJ-26 TaxID=2841522 RepID=UPI001C0F9AED|nr:hypothetical protein [Virgibacillus sp. MSJ-26]MBU5466815.1 hypothetical protein [Virgibacillus sp. MSJ-26]
MYHHYPPNSNEERQMNIPGMIGGLFGFPTTSPPFYGPPPMHPQYPYYPGGGSYPNQPTAPQTGGPPTTPPPNFEPTQPSFQTFAIDPGAIRGCLYKFTYVWLNRESFWFYPVYIGRQSVAGYRWRRNRWVYFGIDLDRIQSFQCF